MEQQKIIANIIECKDIGKTQISTSYNEIEALRRKHFDDITKIYKATEYNENQRNIQNEESHENRLKLLTEFDAKLPDSIAELTEDMKKLMDIEQADLLQAKFEEFKARCQDLMNEKVKLIKEFKNELDFRDQTYVDSMKKFHKDIENMINLMRVQFRDLRKEMLKHLLLIEEKFDEDRKNIIDEQYTVHIKYLISSLETISQKESKKLTELQDKLENEAKEASENLENEYVNKIILLEAHLNTIKERVEEYLYDIKILYEKLEYRLKIREEKIKEAQEKRDQFSKWETKLSDKINQCKENYNKNDFEKRVKNSQLKNELHKMTESFDKLKEKFQHFEKHDELLFKEIYDMKSKEAKELALKVVLADRTIKSQQLGIENIPNDDNKGFSLEELQKDQEIDDSEAQAKTSNKSQAKNNLRQNILDKISIPRVKQVFYYIIDEAEFLIETDIIAKYGKLSLDEKLPEYLESICKALNIKNEHELNQLLELFYKKNLKDKKVNPNPEDNQNQDELNDLAKEENKENDNGENESNNENTDRNNNQNDDILIEPDDVLDILKEFYNEKKRRAKENLRNGISSGDIGLEDNEEAKRERMKYLSETYWEKLGNTISDKTHNVWKALDVALTAYHQLLFERKELVGQVDDLNEKQNELQKLLTNYKNSDINKDLVVKPEDIDFHGGMTYN